jgi:cysteine desulfurase family protein
MEKIIYFDQAATSFPKPPAVIAAMTDYMTKIGGNPGRSGHRLSLEAGRIVFRARELLAQLFRIGDSTRIIFTPNATESINLALFGLLKEGSHVVTSSMEHNAVMRPLRFLEKEKGVTLSIVQGSPEGMIDPKEVKKVLRPDTALIVLNHASNVTGSILPIAEIGALKGNIPMLIDGAQTAGALPIDLKQSRCELFAFTGHKSLMGPMGTGGLCIRKGIDLLPLKYGGTGSNSGSEEMPDILPDRYECGTLNVAGIAGLEAGLRHVLDTGIEKIRGHEMSLTGVLLEGLSKIKGIKIHGPGKPFLQMPTVSINIEGRSSSELCQELDRTYGIMTRAGLQCAPAAHRTLGTHPEGTLRISMGYSNTDEEIQQLLEALEEMATDHE